MSETADARREVASNPITTSTDSSEHSPFRELARLESGAQKLTSLTGTMVQEGIHEISTMGTQLLWNGALIASGVLVLAGVSVYSFLTLTGELANYVTEQWTLSPTERALTFVAINGIVVVAGIVATLGITAIRRRLQNKHSGNDCATTEAAGVNPPGTASNSISRTETPSRLTIVLAKMNLTVARMGRALRHSLNPMDWMRSAPRILLLAGVGIVLFMIIRKKPQVITNASTSIPKAEPITEPSSAVLSIVILLIWKEIVAPLFAQVVRGLGTAALEDLLKEPITKKPTEGNVRVGQVAPFTPQPHSNDLHQSMPG